MDSSIFVAIFRSLRYTLLKKADDGLDKYREEFLNAINDNLNTPLAIGLLFNMIKNDYIVWGLRKTTNGNTLPIRYHLAIDSKPKIGNTYQVFNYIDDLDGLEKCKCAIPYSSYEILIAHPGAVLTYYQAPDFEDKSILRLLFGQK